MSTETILSRMMNEPTFAEAVFADADKALREYNLSAGDLAKFKGLTRVQLQSMTPEERKSMGSYGGVKDPPAGFNHNETALVTASLR